MSNKQEYQQTTMEQTTKQTDLDGIIRAINSSLIDLYQQTDDHAEFGPTPSVSVILALHPQMTFISDELVKKSGWHSDHVVTTKVTMEKFTFYVKYFVHIGSCSHCDDDEFLCEPLAEDVSIAKYQKMRRTAVYHKLQNFKTFREL